MRGVSYAFRDPGLLELAMTHASLDGEKNNERLEFLGDTVLDLIAAEALFEALPGGSEGDLSMAKAWLVSRKTLAVAARRLDLGSRARFGRGLDSEKLPTSVLANLYEALLGAIYRDRGLEAARAFVLSSLADELGDAATEGVERNHKQRLQEWAQKDGGTPPAYHLVDERGDSHRRAFHVAVEARGRRFPAAWGKSRKEAEHWAAHEALLLIQEERL
jgi:ribonuclease-3